MLAAGKEQRIEHALKQKMAQHCSLTCLPFMLICFFRKQGMIKKRQREQ